MSARRVRGRRRRRRHLVLEPLPGRALRRREHATTRYSFSTRARAGVGVDRALPDAAGDPALPQPRRRPLRPAPRHPASSTRVTAAHVRRATRTLDGHAPTTATRSRRASASWPSAACRRPTCPTSRGSTTFEGDWYHTGALAARGRRLHRQARRRHRHRLVRHPGDPADRRAGRAPDRLPAHAELQHPGAQRARWTRSTSARSRPTTPSAAQQARDVARSGIAARPPNDALALEVTPRSAQRELRGALAGAAASTCSSARSPTCSSTREANETAAEFVRDKIREIVQDPAIAELLVPDGPPVRHQAALRRHRLLRDVQPRQRHARRRPASTPIEAITPTGIRTRRRASTSSTSSSSPPASTR